MSTPNEDEREFPVYKVYWGVLKIIVKATGRFPTEEEFMEHMGECVDWDRMSDEESEGVRTCARLWYREARLGHLDN